MNGLDLRLAYIIILKVRTYYRLQKSAHRGSTWLFYAFSFPDEWSLLNGMVCFILHLTTQWCWCTDQTHTSASYVVALRASRGPSYECFGSARVVVVIEVQVVVMLNFRFAVLSHRARVLTNWTTMSDILMKEMESLSISPVKPEEHLDGGRSFLLVDEQENLQVKLASISWANGC